MPLANLNAELAFDERRQLLIKRGRPVIIFVLVMESGENATIAYHLQFGVPSEDDSFMRYMMNEELVRGVLLQSLHDEGVSGCETLGLGPASLLLYE